MGAWRFVREEFLDRISGIANGRVPRYIGREASASPAPGSLKAHNEEQEAIVEASLAVPASADTRVETRQAAPLTS
jgi:2-oxoglutarate dehydrogenase E1 component